MTLVAVKSRRMKVRQKMEDEGLFMSLGPSICMHTAFSSFTTLAHENDKEDDKAKGYRQGKRIPPCRVPSLAFLLACALCLMVATAPVATAPCDSFVIQTDRFFPEWRSISSSSTDVQTFRHLHKYTTIS